MIKTALGLICLIILLSLFSIYGENPQTNVGGYTCYGEECVDPYPREPRKDWGGTVWNDCNMTSIKHHTDCNI